MKKFCLTVSLLGMVLPVLGASSQMAMVSYFPIPYVTYQNVYVHKQLDVGLGSQCEWNVGNSSLSSVPLTATTLNLYGTLNLQNIATLNTTGTSTVTLGVDPSGTEDIKLSFSNLRVETSDRFLNINATDVLELTSGRTDKGLFVYPDVIKEPGKIMSGCEDGVSWQRITEKDGKDGVYLVCGKVTDGTNCSPANGQSVFTIPCTSGYSGSGTHYYWSTQTCKYELHSDDCTDNRKNFICDSSVTLEGHTQGDCIGFCDCDSTTNYFTKEELLKVEEPMVYAAGQGYSNGYFGQYFYKPTGCTSGSKCNCEVGKYYINSSSLPANAYEIVKRSNRDGNTSNYHYSCDAYVKNVPLCRCYE